MGEWDGQSGTGEWDGLSGMGEWDGQSGMGELLPTQILTVEFYNPG